MHQFPAMCKVKLLTLRLDMRQKHDFKTANKRALWGVYYFGFALILANVLHGAI